MCVHYMHGMHLKPFAQDAEVILSKEPRKMAQMPARSFWVVPTIQDVGFLRTCNKSSMAELGLN